MGWRRCKKIVSLEEAGVGEGGMWGIYHRGHGDRNKRTQRRGKEGKKATPGTGEWVSPSKFV
jgi:hypothetical protein